LSKRKTRAWSPARGEGPTRRPRPGRRRQGTALPGRSEARRTTQEGKARHLAPTPPRRAHPPLCTARASATSAVGEFLYEDNGDFVGLTAANNGAAFADAIEIILDEIKEDPTLSDRCRLQAERFPWSETIHRLDTLHPVAAA
jgi:hypothetical protein